MRKTLFVVCILAACSSGVPEQSRNASEEASIFLPAYGHADGEIDEQSADSALGGNGRVRADSAIDANAVDASTVDAGTVDSSLADGATVDSSTVGFAQDALALDSYVALDGVAYAGSDAALETSSGGGDSASIDSGLVDAAGDCSISCDQLNSVADVTTLTQRQRQSNLQVVRKACDINGVVEHSVVQICDYAETCNLIGGAYGQCVPYEGFGSQYTLLILDEGTASERTLIDCAGAGTCLNTQYLRAWRDDLTCNASTKFVPFSFSSTFFLVELGTSIRVAFSTSVNNGEFSKPITKDSGTTILTYYLQDYHYKAPGASFLITVTGIVKGAFDGTVQFMHTWSLSASLYFDATCY
jgi:hypothetical protein